MPFRVTKRVDRFPEYIKRAPQAASDLSKKHTEAWADVMRQLAPEITGRLKRGLEAKPYGTHWAIFYEAPYTKLVNDGTIYQEGQHFIELSREFIRTAFLADLARFNSFL